MKPTLLWIGDAGCPSGFGLATHKILDTLRYHYNVVVLGINYRGDPHSYPYPIFAAGTDGDPIGIGRLVWMCDVCQPDVIVAQGDPWHLPYYTQKLRCVDKTYDGKYGSIPIVGIVAVDGKNCVAGPLNDYAHLVFWTQFGLDEARAGGYTGPASIVPLGVDLNTYYPMDTYEARQTMRLPKFCDDAFIVGNVNRNQYRKRWDLTIRYFARWVHGGRMKDAYLYLHTAPTGDRGVNVRQLASYYGILQRVILHEPPVFYGLPEASMRATYNCFDVAVSTTQGEGFGLTTFEAMACGRPPIVPRWSALEELLDGHGTLVPCTSTNVSEPYVGVVGGVADEEMFVQALDRLYVDREHYQRMRQAALHCVSQPRYGWSAIGNEYVALLAQVMEHGKSVSGGAEGGQRDEGQTASVCEAVS